MQKKPGYIGYIWIQPSVVVHVQTWFDTKISHNKALELAQVWLRKKPGGTRKSQRTTPVPGEGDRDDVGYEDRVKHRFSIADVEGDELLLGAVAWRMAFDRLLKFRSMAPGSTNSWDHLSANLGDRSLPG